MSVIIRTKLVKAGAWRTLESYWNVSGRTLFFNAPAGVQIRLRYSGWWTAVTRQQQTLDGVTDKKLTVGRWSLLTAKAQAKSSQDVQLRYAEGAEGP